MSSDSAAGSAPESFALKDNTVKGVPASHACASRIGVRVGMPLIAAPMTKTNAAAHSRKTIDVNANTSRATAPSGTSA